MKRKNMMLALVIALSFAFILPFANVDAAKKPVLNKKKATLATGKTVKLKVKNTKKKVKWSSNNKKVATVSKKGLVTAKSAGTAKITAKVGKKKLKCTVTVQNQAINLARIGNMDNTYVKYAYKTKYDSYQLFEEKKTDDEVKKEGLQYVGECKLELTAATVSYQNFDTTVGKTTRPARYNIHLAGKFTIPDEIKKQYKTKEQQESFMRAVGMYISALNISNPQIKLGDDETLYSRDDEKDIKDGYLKKTVDFNTGAFTIDRILLANYGPATQFEISNMYFDYDEFDAGE